MKTLERLLTRLAAIAFGALSGALATFIHFAYLPVGLIIALLGSMAASLLVRSYTGSRLSILFFAIAWTVVVLRGGTNSGEELLIMANTAGYTLLYLGPILVFLPLLLPRPQRRNPEVSELV